MKSHKYVISKVRAKKAATGRKLTEQQIRQKIRELVADAQRRLNLDRWVFEIQFGKLTAPDEEHVTLAQAEVLWEYRDAVLTFDSAVLTEYRLGAILKFVVRHEMAHCVNAPMSTLLDKIWELLSTQIQEMETSHIERLTLWGDDDEQ